MRFLYIGLIFLYGCYTPSKADKDLAKIQNKYPEKFTEMAAKLYPVKERVDSIPYIQWRDSIISITDTLHDTARIECGKLTKIIRDIRTKIVQAPPIIKWMEDSSRLHLIGVQLSKEKQESEKYRSRWENWMRISIVFLVLLLISLIAQLIRHKIK
jgi:hypothetical protein